MNKYKVLIVTPGFAENEEDTSCIPALQELMHGLRKLPNYEFRVVAFHFPVKEYYKWHGVPIISAGNDNPKKLKKLIALYKFHYQLKKEIDKFKPNIIHGFWLTDAGLSAAKIGTQLKIPTLLTAMGQDVKPSFYTSRIKKLKIPIISISEFQNTKLEKMHMPIRSIIHLGIHPLLIQQPKIKEIDIVIVGSLIPVKNPGLALTIVYNLIREGVSVKTSFIGDGPLRKELEVKANKLGIRSSVNFLGMLNREETLKHMSTAKILLHTSKFEGFGLVLVEAEALGLHIVSSPVGIAPKIKDVHIFNNETECLDQLKKCLETRKEPHNSFPINTTVNAYHSLYNELINH